MTHPLPTDHEGIEGIAAKLANAARLAAKVFRNYEQLHRQKGTPEGTLKANLNRWEAEELEDALSAYDAAQQSQGKVEPRRVVTDADVGRASEAMTEYLPHYSSSDDCHPNDIGRCRYDVSAAAVRAALESFAATRPPVEGADADARDAERLNWVHAQFYLGNIRINGLLPVGGENYCKDRLNSHIDAARSAQAAQGEGGKS